MKKEEEERNAKEAEEEKTEAPKEEVNPEV